MKHLPDYPADERTRYRVRIGIEGSIHWIRSCMTLDEAQRRYIAFRNGTGLGASGFSTGDVFDEAGQHLARISYNGRLWPVWPERAWTPDMKPLAEAPREGSEP